MASAGGLKKRDHGAAVSAASSGAGEAVISAAVGPSCNEGMMNSLFKICGAEDDISCTLRLWSGRLFTQGKRAKGGAAILET